MVVTSDMNMPCSVTRARLWKLSALEVHVVSKGDSMKNSISDLPRTA